MSPKASLLFLGLIAGTAGLPASFAAANTLGSAGGITGRVPTQVTQAAAQSTADKAALEQKRKAAALKKKKQQQAAAAAKAQALKAQQLQAQQQKKKEWYEDDRDRGLDIAAKYAPKTIARVREKNYIAKGDTVSTGNGKKGWQHYVDRYYSR
ncbi:hypothetical protein [Hyphomicrobium sp.]|uniref:hypothetical protein n=1 Tax=Hyphomicrobium sp. TaxID=82 RepID=UPI0025BA0141|nr:hypothetical protein [Hyphomicrobium sp.]MCC7252106.1 hypothetical protein [Hyphomicrobium sp.]